MDMLLRVHIPAFQTLKCAFCLYQMFPTPHPLWKIKGIPQCLYFDDGLIPKGDDLSTHQSSAIGKSDVYHASRLCFGPFCSLMVWRSVSLSWILHLTGFQRFPPGTQISSVFAKPRFPSWVLVIQLDAPNPWLFNSVSDSVWLGIHSVQTGIPNCKINGIFGVLTSVCHISHTRDNIVGDKLFYLWCTAK